MMIAAFVGSCGLGAALGLLARPSPRLGRLIALVFLAGAFVSALLLTKGESISAGQLNLSATGYSAAFLASATGACLLLCLVGLDAGWPDRLGPAALAAFAGIGVSIMADDPGVALTAGAAAAASGTLLALHGAPATVEDRPEHLVREGRSAKETRERNEGRLAEIRILGIVIAGLLVAGLAVRRPSWTTGDAPIVVAAFLLLGLAVAIRSGSVPFHVPAAHLARRAVPMAPALLLVWIPAGLGLLALSWNATTFGVHSQWLNLAVVALQWLAIATLILGGLAALVHDELEEVVTYSIVQDSGFILLALAARNPDAADAARLWLLVFVLAKTALVAWVGAMSVSYGSSHLGNLRGWIRHSPLLGLALLAIAVATVGWPTSAVFDARQRLAQLALPGQPQILLWVVALLTIAVYARLVFVGLRLPLTMPAAESETTGVEGAGEAEVSAAAAVPASAQVAAGAAEGVEVPGEAPVVVAAAAVATTPLVSRRRRLPARVSLVVAASAVVALATAFGSLGASNASLAGIPLNSAAVSTPTPPPPASITPTPEPTKAPAPTPTPVIVPSNTVAPSVSPTPTKSVAPGTPWAE